jgi:hypothetical protein
VSTPTRRRRGSGRVRKKLEEKEAKTKAQEEEEKEEEEDEVGEEEGEEEEEEDEVEEEEEDGEDEEEEEEEAQQEEKEQEKTNASSAIVMPTVGTSPTIVTTPVSRVEDVVSTLDDDTLSKIKNMRKIMMLDVLSKISSMAKQKKIDQPFLRQSKRRLLLTKDYLDLDTIAAQVREGKLWNWNLLTRDVFLFCNNVIADGEKDREAKQNGIELLHFAKILTEQVKKACYKKEENMKQPTGNKSSDTGTGNAAVITTTGSDTTLPDAPVQASTSAPIVPSTPAQAPATVTRGPGRPRGSTNQSHLVHQASPLKDLGTASSSGDNQVTTPQRVSARIRKRADSSTQDDASVPTLSRPSTPKIVPPSASTTTETGKKRQRNTSAVVETSSLAESDQSDADSKTNSASATPTGTGGTMKRRTRKRRPVGVATRVSSRQKRAREVSRDADTTGGEEDYEEENEDVERRDDTEGVTDEPQSSLPTQEDTTKSQESKPVLLTKDGRPRKKPGRKPGSGKKKQIPNLQQETSEKL